MMTWVSSCFSDMQVTASFSSSIQVRKSPIFFYLQFFVQLQDQAHSPRLPWEKEKLEAPYERPGKNQTGQNKKSR
jgi:hypothetical protein